MITMVMFLDYSGLPRAYAYGPAKARELIEATARTHLAAYCAQKRLDGEIDLADASRYHMLVVDDVSKLDGGT